MSARRALVVAHRWLGLVLGLHLALLGVSGVYLALHRPIDLALSHRSDHDATATLPDVVAAARAALSTEREPRAITVPPEGSRTDWVISFDLTEPGARRRFVNAYVDTGTGEVRETRDARRTLYGVMFGFHHDLFSGRLGHTLVALSGVLSLVIVISGIVILWPPRLRHLGALFVPRPFRTPRGLAWDLHRATGVWSLVVLALVIASGVVLAEPGWFGAPAGRRGGGAPDPITIDYAALERALPDGARTIRVTSAKLTIEHTGGTLELDARTLAPLAPSPAPTGLVPAMRALHAGDYAGPIGPALTVLSGVVSVALWITGALAMLSRSLRKKRRALAR